MQRSRPSRPASALAEAIAALPDGPWYRRSEIAALIGVSSAALITLGQRHPHLAPRQTYWHGRVGVGLYAHEQYLAIAEHRRHSHGGRPRRWSTADSEKRVRLMDRRKYYRRKARRLQSGGDTPGYREAIRQADRIDRELAQQTPGRA